MPSSIWTGAISFGLVQVPVKLVGATKSKDVSFNQLEEGTGARIRYRKVSDKTGDEVTADKIVRGFEVSKGRYVVIEPSEIDSLRPKGSHEIEIEEFVDLGDIDPLYFEQPYYLVPDKRGEKPYALLLDAMTSLNKVAIGRIVMRSKERLVAIRPVDGALCVETMRYADEVLPAEGIAPEGRQAHARRSARWRASSSSRSRPRSSSPRSTTTSTASSSSTSSRARSRARRSSPSRTPSRRPRCSISSPRWKRRSRSRRRPRTATERNRLACGARCQAGGREARDQVDLEVDQGARQEGGTR